MLPSPIIAAGVGNTSIQCGLFQPNVDTLPAPAWQQSVSNEKELPENWLADRGLDEVLDATWCVASVNQNAETH